MLGRVQRTQRGLVIPVTAEMAESLDLTEGAQVEVLPVAGTMAVEDVTRYATEEQVLDSFERTLPQHENAYRALAK